MFVERSARRVARARWMFVIGALLPTAAVVAVAVYARGAGRRGALEARASAALSAPVRIGAVRDPLPGVTVLDDVRVGSGDGAVIRLARVRVEESAAEIRLAIESCDCPPRAVALAAAVARAWLAGDPRFRRAWVVECVGLTWGGPAAAHHGGDDAAARTRVRVECVAADGVRALRAVAQGVDGADDEIRLSRGGADGPGGERWEVAARVGSPVPVAVVAALAGALPTGREPETPAQATVRGEALLAHEGGSWRGTVTAVAEGIDLADVTAALPVRTTGTARLTFDSVAIDDGKIVAGTLECRSPSGAVSRRFIDGCIDWLGCRPPPSFPDGDAIPYRDMAWRCRLADGQIFVDGLDRGATLLVGGDGPLLRGPSGGVPLDRLAWVLSPPGVPAVPATQETGALLRWLPFPAPRPSSRTARAGN